MVSNIDLYPQISGFRRFPLTFGQPVKSLTFVLCRSVQELKGDTKFIGSKSVASVVLVTFAQTQLLDVICLINTFS